MTAKEYLGQLPALKEDIRRAEEKAKEIEARISSGKAMRYDAIRVQTSPENTFENEMLKHVEILQRVEKMREEYENLYSRITRELDSLEPKYRRALKFRYLDGRSVTWIANRMHYTVEHTYHILADGRREFTEKYL